MNNFYEFAKECHQDRIENAYQNKLDNPLHLTKIKSDFICYYRSNSKPFCMESFEQFLTAENVNINQIEKNWIVKRLFGEKKLV